MPDPFEKRIRRAETLENDWAFASELLGFFKTVFRLQNALHADLRKIAVRGPSVLDTLTFLPALFHLVEEQGPATFRPQVAGLRGLGREHWEEFSITYIQLSRFRSDPCPQDFFVRVLLEPLYALLNSIPVQRNPDEASDSMCPVCQGRPIVSILREDKSADTVRRTLYCPLCSLEWGYARVLCPFCREESPEKLPRYTAQEISWMRVEACDSCGKYLKAVDLTLNWNADPVVDELASTPLDVIANNNGYAKIVPNLAGI
jgi:formate dehydrogenase accessory protein FdhE